MARSEITVGELGRDLTLGSALTEDQSDGSNEHMFANTGNEYLIVRNNDGALTCAVEIVSTEDDYGRTVTISENVAAGEMWAFGPFNPARWNQKTGNDRGKVYVNVDQSDADITLAVFRAVSKDVGN